MRSVKNWTWKWKWVICDVLGVVVGGFWLIVDSYWLWELLWLVLVVASAIMLPIEFARVKVSSDEQTTDEINEALKSLYEAGLVNENREPDK